MAQSPHDDTDRDVRSLVEERLAEADGLAAAGTALESAVHGLNNPLAALMLDLEQLCEQIVYVMPSAERSDAARTLADARAEAQRLAAGIRDLARLVPRDQPKRVELHDLLLSVLHLVERQYGGRVCIHRRLTVEGDIVTREARFAHLVRGVIQRVVAEARADSGDERVDVLVVATQACGVFSLRVSPRTRGSIERASLLPPRASVLPPPVSRLPAGLSTPPVMGSLPPARFSIAPAALEPARDPVLSGVAQQLGGALHTDRNSYVLVLPMEVPLGVSEPTESARKRPSAPEMGEIRILVVDDEVSLQRSLARALRELGVVQTVSSVRSAVELLAGGAVFDVVLCDVVMPECSGIELVAWLDQHRPRLKRRVILMSGMQEAHADAYPDVPTVQKPFDLRALRELVCDVAVRG